MISFLSGVVRAKKDGTVTLDVNGVGYLVHATPDVFAKCAVGESVSFWTHLAVRENALELFGFSDEEELSLFELLIGISGIGPRSALAILSLASPQTLRKAIGAEDTKYLTKISGIGKKTAEKIVLELKDKIGEGGAHDPRIAHDADVLEALVSLGYSREEGRAAVKKIDAEISGTNNRIKAALKHLSDREQ